MKSLRDIYEDYRANKFPEEVCSDWGSVVFYRVPGMVLAWLLAKTPATPNMVTAVNVFILPCMIAAALLLAPAMAFTMILALALAYQILDCTDGLLARVTGQTSRFGHFCDLVADVAYRGIFYTSLGYVADRLAPSTLPIDQATVLAFSAWLALFARLARSSAERLSDLPQPEEAHRFTIFSFFSGLDTLCPLLALAAWSFGYSSAFVVWMLLFSLGDVAAALMDSAKRFR